MRLVGMWGSLVVIALVVGLLSFRTVPSGEVAVVTRFGQVTGRVLNPGASLIWPFVEGTVYYNTKKITYETVPVEKKTSSNADYKDFPVDTNTKDGQPVDISYTVRFSVDPTKATWVAQNIGPEEALVGQDRKPNLGQKRTSRPFGGRVIYRRGIDKGAGCHL